MYINVNNIRLHYQVFGKGKEIILLNPNSTNTSFMKFIAHKLKEDFKVYLVDRRCSGKSEKNCPLTYEDSAKDIYEFIKTLNLDKPYILGSSGGASVGMLLAINFPDSISKLVLCSAVANFESIKMPSYFNILNKLPWYPNKKSINKFIDLNNSAKNITEADLSKISVPTLVVNGGEKDIVSIYEAKFISKNISNSKLLILEKESHSSYLINIKWYDNLKNFLLS